MGNERPSLRKSWKFPGSAWVQQARAAFRPTCWLMQVLPMSGLHPRDPLQGPKTDIAREVRCSRQCRRRIESRYPLTFPRRILWNSASSAFAGVSLSPLLDPKNAHTDLAKPKSSRRPFSRSANSQGKIFVKRWPWGRGCLGIGTPRNGQSFFQPSP